jgi:Na+-transporting methylmalonyl-CoA/oxaloacetate decarboxylase gamma subunit
MSGAMAFLSTLMAIPAAEVGPAGMSDGAGITIVGMITVFIGLAALTLLLPVLRRIVEKDFGKGAGAAEKATGEHQGLTTAEVVAISTAIHAHLCTQTRRDSMKLTWEDHDKPYTPWRFAGRAEHLSGLETVQSRIRSR